jgi:hypothetical protein
MRVGEESVNGGVGPTGSAPLPGYGGLSGDAVEAGAWASRSALGRGQRRPGLRAIRAVALVAVRIEGGCDSQPCSTGLMTSRPFSFSYRSE